MNRTILHIDMDAFFASVEQLDNPKYRGKPVIVGADPKGGKGRGVVAAASYEARKYGVHSALPISTAYRRCPQGIFVPGRGKRYAEISNRIMDIFHSYTPLVEAISLDEAFLDISGMKRLYGEAENVGRKIKSKIKEQEGLTASVGIAPNKLLAKIASDLEKPDGFVVVKPEKIEEFLFPLPIGRLWGIGKKTKEKLDGMGISTVGQLAKLTEKDCEKLFGKTGLDLWQRAHGCDDRGVVSTRKVKSISNERTYEQDEYDPSVHKQTLLFLSEKVGYRLRKQNLFGRTVTIKIRLGDFTTLVRHATLSKPVMLGEAIYSEALLLYHGIDLQKKPIRLVGVGVTQLSAADEEQVTLFAEIEGKRKRATEAIDKIKEKFGERKIGRGTYLSSKNKHEF